MEAAQPQTCPAHQCQSGRKEGASPSTGSGATKPITLDSTLLLHGRQEVLIRHGDETYRLRRTRQGKLILTK